MYCDLSDLGSFTKEQNFFGLIVVDDIGILFENQCGGVNCSHPQAIGFYIPLSNGWRPLSDPLRDFWEKYDVDKVKKYLSKMNIFDNPFAPLENLSIVSEIMDSSDLNFGEAWIPIEIIKDVPPFKGMAGRIGIIVYENSD